MSVYKGGRTRALCENWTRPERCWNELGEVGRPCRRLDSLQIVRRVSSVLVYGARGFDKAETLLERARRGRATLPTSQQFANCSASVLRTCARVLVRAKSTARGLIRPSAASR